MSLDLYKNATILSKLSSRKPFTVTFDGRTGGAIENILYIRNDDRTKWYNDISLEVVDPFLTGIVFGEKEGFSWKLLEKDIAPTQEEWSLILPGSFISISSGLGTSLQGNIATFLPFWVRVESPSNQPVSAVTNVSFRIKATENLVNV